MPRSREVAAQARPRRLFLAPSAASPRLQPDRQWCISSTSALGSARSSRICSQARRGAMGSRLVGSAALCAGVAVLLGLFLGQCSCQSAPQTIVLGGASGWTDTANVNYTLFMSTVQFLAGDTLRFNNTDTVDHDVLQVYSQADYDTCNNDNSTGWTINVGDFHDMAFLDPTYRVWLMDSQNCSEGMKVEFMVLNADGTAVAPDTTADPPSLNAPIPDPTSPPSPPAAPLGQAGGPAPNAAPSSLATTVHWTVLAVLVAACYLAH